MEYPVRYRLLMRQGPNPGKIYELNKDILTIGRDVNNDIVIADAEVSRSHARLTVQAGGYLVEDLGSTNGSFVDGQRLTSPQLLRPGAILNLGETVSLEFQAAEEEVVATKIASPVVAAAMETTPDSVAPPTVIEPSPPAAPPQNKSRAGLYIGIGCGCVALALCVLLTAIIVYMVWQGIGPFAGSGSPLFLLL